MFFRCFPEAVPPDGLLLEENPGLDLPPWDYNEYSKHGHRADH